MSKIIQKKIWQLTTELDHSGIVWCSGLGIEVNVPQMDTQEFICSGDVFRYSVPSKSPITIITTTDKQEQMLKLKYSTDLVLLSSFVQYDNQLVTFMRT